MRRLRHSSDLAWGMACKSWQGGIKWAELSAHAMNYKKISMELNKKIALVAHDNMKRDLVEWAKFNRDLLARHKIFATGTTGLLLEKELGIDISKLQSGP